jgi:hypothetical protein
VVVLVATIVSLGVWAGFASGTQPYETYESAVAAAGPVSQFRFSDAVGSGTIADSAGSYTATNDGVVLGGEGPFAGSKSGSFGGEAFAALPSDPLKEASAFTVEGWVDWSGEGATGQPIFDFGSGAGNAMYVTPYSSVSSKHPMRFVLETSAGTASVSATKSFPTGAWEYVAVTETSAGAIVLYFDGESVGTTSATVSPASLGSVSDDYLGKSAVSGGPAFKGSLSNVAVYSKALTAAQVKEHYEDGDAPFDIEAPTISGTVREGSVLSAKEGVWTGLAPISFAYKWQICTAPGECAAISKATKASYTPDAEEVGETLRVAVAASNAAGERVADSAQTATVEGKPANTELPVISGKAEVGQLLSTSYGAWRAFPAPEYKFQWQSCNSKGKSCTNTSGATEAQYRVPSGKLGDKLQAVVTAKNPLGEATAESAPTAVVTAGPPVSVEAPTISGTAREGQTLTATAGTWAGSEPISIANYQWLRCTGGECHDIEGASGAKDTEYKLAAADVDSTIEVQVSAKNSVGETAATSTASAVVASASPANTVAPSIAGMAEEGETLTANVGSWSGAAPISYSYQWQSCSETGEDCANIEGAASSSYQTGPGDVGSTVRVLVTASNEAGAVSVASRLSAVIGTAVTEPLSLAPPEVSGSDEPRQTLSASVGSWAGARPISYAYQWESCSSAGEDCADVSGATGSTYQLGAGDIGDTLRVLVTATNAAGVASRVSAATEVIAESLSESGSTCTDSWVGPSEGSWQEAADWSTGSPPGPGDVACVSAGTTVIVGEGKAQAGVLDDAGGLLISGGSLELTNAAEASTLASLTLTGSGAALTGAGSVYVSGSFDWGVSAVMSGSGATVIESGVSGTVYARSGCEPMELSDGRKLVNEGTLTFGWGTLYMSEGARLENEGSFVDSSEASCLGPQIQPEGSGAAPAILNTGTFEKAASYGTSTVAVAFTNDGGVSAYSGTLEFTGGGVPEQAATGAWSVEPGASIVLGGGTFLIGEGVSLSEVTVEGATVTRVSPPVVNTAAPSIAGSAEDGQTLTAGAGSWSGAEPISFSYSWQRCNASGEECRDIASATSGSYTLDASDIGATIRVLVTASNSSGQAQASSPASAVVTPPPPPVNTALPAVSGQAQDGSVLSAGRGSWDAAAPVSYAYQWESCNAAGEECAPVEYATTSRYELSEGDVGSTLRAVVTATNAGGSTRVTSAASTEIEAEPVSELQAPSISGSADDHQVLDADPGRWAGTETQIGYQWESCSESGTECAPVEGATGTEYDLAEGDVGSRLRVRVGASNARDSLTDVSAVTSVVGAAGALANVSAPSISGAPQSGQALTANSGGWSGAGSFSYRYQWQICNSLGYGCEDVEGANATSYAPPAGEVGRTLRVLVTASEEGHELSAGSPATQPVAAALAPAIEQAPPIAGAALAGHTLIAGTGVFSGEGPISYSYQWQRCAKPGECANIEGATGSSYALTGEDVGSTVLVRVSAADSAGSTTAVAAPTAAVGPEALLALSSPSIAGVAQPEGTLSADPGIWSADGPVSYAYQWEGCDAAGEDCAPVEGATEATYVLASADVGSSLRVNVTATSPLGSTSANSSPIPVTASGEVSVEEAQAIAERTDPALLAPSTPATLEEESIAPTLADTGEELASNSTLTTSTISKEIAGAFAVNTPAGEVSLSPVESSPHANTPPTIVNGAAALLANAWTATDTIVRPAPLGATALLDIRSAQAPRSFSWQVNLGPDEELEQLPDGAIAMLETPEEEAAQQNSAEEAGEASKLDETTEGPAETSEEKAEAEQVEAESKTGEAGEEEAPLPTLPAAPTSTTAAGEAGPGQPQPQNTQNSYETAKTAMSYAEAQTAGKALLTIAPPAVTDAEGATVPAALSTTGDTITLTIKPAAGVTYPLFVDTTVAAPTNKQSMERDPVKYGISDPKANEPGHIDEHFTTNGTVAPKLDPNLYDGPPHTTRHMRTARLIVPYDVLVTPVTQYRSEERSVLETWLKKVTKEGLEPYITIGRDESKDPCGAGAEAACPQPSVGQYKKAVTKLMEEVIRWHASRRLRLVKLWGAWNEPDDAQDPLHKDAPRAAQFWEVAQTILHDIAPHYPCNGCTAVAGEFSTFYPEYTSCYREVLLYSYCELRHKRYYYMRYWSGKPRDPSAWGFHDYEDLLHRNDTVARHFAKFAQTRLEKPRLFMSEAGVELQTGKSPETELGELEAKTEGEKEQKRYLQLQAAEEFLKLPDGLPYPIDRMYYYQYSAPTKAQQEEHVFDSALLEEEDGERRERPAYCVLAYEDHRCPPITTTGPNVGIDVEGYTEKTVKVTGMVNPEDLPTEYRFEYGQTPSSLGSKTTPEKLKAGLSADEVSAEFTLTVSTEECFDSTTVAYFRIEATNATGTRYGSVGRLYPACPD